MNIVFCAYAYKEDYQSGYYVQTEKTQDVYLKNAFVVLKGFKLNNPDDDVASIANLALSEC